MKVMTQEVKLICLDLQIWIGQIRLILVENGIKWSHLSQAQIHTYRIHKLGEEMINNEVIIAVVDEDVVIRTALITEVEEIITNKMVEVN